MLDVDSQKLGGRLMAYMLDKERKKEERHTRNGASARELSHGDVNVIG